MHFRHISLLVLGGVVSICWPDFGMAQTIDDGPNEQSESPDRILEAWRVRQAALPRGRIRWEETQIGRAEERLPSSDNPADTDRKPPEGDTINVLLIEVAWSGIKTHLRQELSDSTLDLNGEVEAQLERIAVFDGAELRGLGFHPGVEFPRGSISDAAQPGIGNDTRFRAVVLHFFPLDSDRSGFRWDGLTVSPIKAVVDGIDCVVAELPLTDVGMRYRLCLDKDRDYIVRQAQLLSADAEVRHQLDVTYAEDAEMGWVPAQWTMQVLTERGTARFSYEGRVVEQEFEEPPPTLFTLTFPPGTHVTDRRNRDTYLVTDNGGERPILRSEILSKVTHEELLNTEPGEAVLVPRNRGTMTWLLIINGIVLLGVLIAFRISQRRRARSGGAS